ncbi:MAG: threonine--tRNA ligase [Bacilli bacterium]|nr:threonine--tRNA ligase [Acholeplasmataceae bacterium]HPZ27156.1 threonine--tRNA ligase [Bacilli bacterium]
MKITFLDGSAKEYPKAVSPLEIAEEISASLAKKSVYAKINGMDYDLSRLIDFDATVELVTMDKPEALDVLRHSCSHLMASAIKSLYPGAQFGVGPAIEEGFYYDVNPGEGVRFNDEDLPRIEEEMRRIASEGLKFERIEVSKEKALEMFRHDRYKTELIKELPEGEVITVYRHGDFADLCRGPHVPGTKMLKHFKLLNVSGAYWRGDSRNEQLQRIYGTCFFDKKELESHLQVLKERAERDHRKIGRELRLFMISEYGPGFPFWLPKGMALKQALMDYWYKVHEREGYRFIQTPIMLSKELWEISGHWRNYREGMYTSEIDEREFAVKPMNCPGGMLVYKHEIHSYRDLPLRVGELGLVHRHEASGALSGLFRVRSFTQDDAHIYMEPKHIVSEVGRLIKLFDEVYSVFDLSYAIDLSTRPEEKFIGSVEVWDIAEKTLAEACRSVRREFRINPGDGAFYGPKLDFQIRDSMNRVWQCGTIQLDMMLPERFDLFYINEKGEKVRPVMLHRALFGSIERFIGILIEHYGGAFPTWLAPVQVKLIPVSNEHHREYVEELEELFKKNNIRVESDFREEKLSYKIREAQIQKIPYQLVIGNKEIESRDITYRRYRSQESVTVPVDQFINMVVAEIKTMGKS